MTRNIRCECLTEAPLSSSAGRDPERNETEDAVARRRLWESQTSVLPQILYLVEVHLLSTTVSPPTPCHMYQSCSEQWFSMQKNIPLKTKANIIPDIRNKKKHETWGFGQFMFGTQCCHHVVISDSPSQPFLELKLHASFFFLCLTL